MASPTPGLTPHQEQNLLQGNTLSKFIGRFAWIVTKGKERLCWFMPALCQKLAHLTRLAKNEETKNDNEKPPVSDGN
jgi:hypothetical protein